MRKPTIVQLEDYEPFVGGEAVERVVLLLRDEPLRERLGKQAKESVSKHFLLTRSLEQYLDLFNSFETIYRLTRLP